MFNNIDVLSPVHTLKIDSKLSQWKIIKSWCATRIYLFKLFLLKLFIAISLHRLRSQNKFLLHALTNHNNKFIRKSFKLASQNNFCLHVQNIAQSYRHISYQASYVKKKLKTTFQKLKNWTSSQRSTNEEHFRLPARAQYSRPTGVQTLTKEPPNMGKRHLQIYILNRNLADQGIAHYRYRRSLDVSNISAGEKTEMDLYGPPIRSLAGKNMYKQFCELQASLKTPNSKNAF